MNSNSNPRINLFPDQSEGSNAPDTSQQNGNQNSIDDHVQSMQDQYISKLASAALSPLPPQMRPELTPDRLDMLKSVGNTMLPFALTALVPEARPAIALGKTAYKYLNPQNDVEAFKDSLGSNNAEQNIAEAAKRIQFAGDTNKSEALSTKQKVLDDTSHIEDMFNPKDSSFKGSESKYLSKYPGNSENPYDKGSTLADAHDAFVKNPNFKNSDNLYSELGMEIGGLTRLSQKDQLDRQGLALLRSHNYDQNLIRQDQDEFLKNFSPDLKNLLDKYRYQWRVNVVPYGSSNTLKAITRGRQTSGITPSELDSDFAFPRGQGNPVAGQQPKDDLFIQKIIQDIGPGGRNNILNNHLIQQKASDAQDLLGSLVNARDRKGFSDYVTPEMINHATMLAKREKYGTWAKAGLGSVGGDIIGGPWGGLAGGALGYGFKNIPHLFEHIAKFVKKG